MFKTVGHRGLPESYPENTLVGFEKAIQAGADAIECDIQFSRDQVPFLLHDPSLLRTARLDFDIKSLSAAELVDVKVGEVDRLGERFYDVTLQPLSALMTLLESHLNVDLFLEVKAESLTYIDRDLCLKILSNICASCIERVVLISFDFELLMRSRSELNPSFKKMGWVLSEYSDEALNRARELSPDFLIVDKKKLLPDVVLWEGHWQWFVYDIVDPDEAWAYFQRGVQWIESWDVRALT